MSGTSDESGLVCLCTAVTNPKLSSLLSTELTILHKYNPLRLFFKLICYNQGRNLFFSAIRGCCPVFLAWFPTRSHLPEIPRKRKGASVLSVPCSTWFQALLWCYGWRGRGFTILLYHSSGEMTRGHGAKNEENAAMVSIAGAQRRKACAIRTVKTTRNTTDAK